MVGRWTDAELHALENPDEWEEGVSEGEPSLESGAVVMLRFSGGEFDHLDRAAEAGGVSVIEFIREAALGRAGQTDAKTDR